MNLWLKYTNENGDARRVLVNAEKFSIGRHSENDLCIPKNQLSRRHAEIDRYEDVFVLTDLDSSNGTTLNGKTLERPTALENGDKINLGGGAEIQIEIISAAPKVQDSAARAASFSNDSSQEKAAAAESVEQAEIASTVTGKDFVPAIVQSAAPKKSGMGIIFILAPVLVLVVLVFGGLLFLLFGGSNGKDVSQNPGKGTFTYSDDNDDEKPNKKSDNSNKTPTPSPKDNSNNQPANSSSTPDAKNAPNNSAPPASSENDTIETNALSFLRRIAKTDPNPVLTQKQINEIGAAIKSFKGSAVLKDNLQQLKKNSAQIETLAKSKNLRPQFLAVAALAKIGSARGDVLATAQNMANDLSDLSNQIANDFSDDSLMIIAAYGEGGGKSGMPSMLANLTKNSPADARKIRTIWFLRDNGKISDAQYQFALRFLAIGAITQNPKDFNVEAEAVIFN
ncbi:MAG: FHA domain-containing protein [Pyrinomonadaceae bacterium]